MTKCFAVASFVICLGLSHKLEAGNLFPELLDAIVENRPGYEVYAEMLGSDLAAVKNYITLGKSQSETKSQRAQYFFVIEDWARQKMKKAIFFDGRYECLRQIGRAAWQGQLSVF